MDVGVETSDQMSVTYELDHLASFGVTAKQATAVSALEKLKLMETTTGVWAMKVFLHIDRRQVVVVDKASQKVSNGVLSFRQILFAESQIA